MTLHAQAAQIVSLVFVALVLIWLVEMLLVGLATAKRSRRRW